MAVAAKKATGIEHPAQEMHENAASQPTRQPWRRQEGESSLWFNRFHRYMRMGVKRSLQAAVEEERADFQAMKSTKTDDNGVSEMVSNVSNGSPVKHTPMKEVPRPRQMVPGSWKQASVQWHWKERALAYDDWCVDTVAEEHLGELLDGEAIGIERVRILKQLLAAITKTYNSHYDCLELPMQLAYVARMQSILKDIRDEMASYDESLTRILVHRRLRRIYDSATPEELKAKRIEAKS